MMKTRSVTLNFFMNFLLTASSVLFPLITFPYVSRILGPSGTGAVAMGTSLVSYFTMVAMLGVPTYGIRACARVRDNRRLLSRTVQELLIINLGMMVIAYGLFFILILAVPSFRTSFELYTICSAAILLNVIGVNWVYQALEDYTYITMISLLFKVIGIVILFLFVRSRNNVLMYALVTVVSSFGSGLFNFLRLRKLISLQPCGPYHFRRHIRPILTFFAMSVASTVYTNLDTVMLGVMKDDTAVGYYNAAVKVKTIMVTMVTSLGTVLLPRLSYYYEQKKKKAFLKLVSRAFSFVLLFSLPCCIFFTFYAREIMLILSGSEYLPAVAPMIILMPTIILIGLSNITGIQILVPQGKESMVLRSVVLGAAVDFVLNLVLIPAFGPSGASWGTLAAEIAVLAFQCYVLQHLLRRILPHLELKILLGSVIPFTIVSAFCLLLPVESAFVRLLIAGLCSFGLYGLLLFLFREAIVMTVLRRALHVGR